MDFDYSDEENFAPNDIYQLYYHVNYTWPCLSFDVLPDNLGASRSTFPHSASFVAATQASDPKDNAIIVTHLSQMRCTKNDDEEGVSQDQDHSNMKEKSFPYNSTTNRIKVYRGRPCITATTDANKVISLWDVSNENSPLICSTAVPGNSRIPEEGYGLCWSPTSPTLAGGFSDGTIWIWDCSSGALVPSSTIPTEHGSVEDLVFSPDGSPVLCSCGTDGTVMIWDRRASVETRTLIKASNSDVNVVDWNPSLQYRIVSGADDGVISVWDLRMLSDDESGLTMTSSLIQYHQEPITSVGWNPNDECEFAVCADDNSLTIWDTSIEKGDDTETDPEIPDQLLFIHHVISPKELHYHPQVQKMIAVTGEDGLDVFIPDIEVSEETTA